MVASVRLPLNDRPLLLAATNPCSLAAPHCLQIIGTSQLVFLWFSSSRWQRGKRILADLEERGTKILQPKTQHLTWVQKLRLNLASVQIGRLLVAFVRTYTNSSSHLINYWLEKGQWSIPTPANHLFHGRLPSSNNSHNTGVNTSPVTVGLTPNPTERNQKIADFQSL